MNIDDLTIGQAREIANLIDSACVDTHPYPIGKSVLVRTVTMILTGRLVEVGPQELVLEDAAWVADTGRYTDALKTGNLREVEPYPDGRVIVGRGALIDCCEWLFPLPRSQK